MTRIKSAIATADGTILTGAGTYYGCRVVTDGTNVGRVTVYDNTAASGTVIDDVSGAAGSVTSTGAPFTCGIPVYTGIHLDVTTVGRVVVWYT